MSDPSRSSIPDELKAAFNEQGFREEVEGKADAAVNRIKFQAALYLNEEGQRELEAKAKEHLAAIIELEALSQPEQRAAQSVIIGDIEQQYDACFIRQKVREQWASIDAKREVLAFVKDVGGAFAKTAVNVAFKHGLNVLKGGF